MEVLPSPNNQDHVSGSLVERSVKVTVSGTTPSVGSAEKSATGGFTGSNT